jgi:hypothetical protein
MHRKYTSPTKTHVVEHIDDGQLTLQRFSKKERRAIAKARNKAKKIDSGFFWNLYCHGMFPRAMTCHRNSQVMCMLSGLQLTYNEGWVLYRTGENEKGLGICYHAWNEYEDGTVLDTTWDFEFYPVTQMSLGTAEDCADRLREYYAAGDKLVFNRTALGGTVSPTVALRGFMKFHGDNFFFCQEKALFGDGDDSISNKDLLTSKVWDVLESNERFKDCEILNAEETVELMYEMVADHMKHTVVLRSTIIESLAEAGVVELVSPALLSERQTAEEVDSLRDLVSVNRNMPSSKGVWDNMI